MLERMMAGVGGFGGDGCWISPMPSLLAEPSRPRAIISGKRAGGDDERVRTVLRLEDEQVVNQI